MRRSILLTVVVLAISSFAVSQVVVTSQGYATMQGAAIAPAQISPPLLTTPSVSVTALPPAQVGITNNGVQMGAISALATPNANVTGLSYPAFGYSTPMGYGLPIGYAPISYSNLPSSYVPSAMMSGSIDVGVGNVSNLNPNTSDNHVDIVAIANAYKSQRRTNPRVYTNEDIRQLNQLPNSDVSVIPQQPEELSQNISSDNGTNPQPQETGAAASNAPATTALPNSSEPAVRPALSKPSPFVPRRTQPR